MPRVYVTSEKSFAIVQFDIAFSSTKQNIAMPYKFYVAAAAAAKLKKKTDLPY